MAMMRFAIVVLLVATLAGAQNNTAGGQQGIDEAKRQANSFLDGLNIFNLTRELVKQFGDNFGNPLTFLSNLRKEIQTAFDANNNRYNSFVSNFSAFNLLQNVTRNGFFGLGNKQCVDQDKPKNQTRYKFNYTDYRAAGIMTPVKDQGQCASCYAFAATGAVESQCMKKNNKDLGSCVFSEQQIIDCTGRKYENNTQNRGCKEGSSPASLEYYNAINVSAQAKYPYTQIQGICRVAQIAATRRVYWATVQVKNEDHLAYLLEKYGPVIVYIYASPSFNRYKSGVYNNWRGCCSGALNHAVLIVGVTRVDGVDAWIVKNSWGSSWGLNGYLMMQKDKEMCQMLLKPAIVVSFDGQPDTAPPAPAS